jgi:hypothetical protein
MHVFDMPPQICFPRLAVKLAPLYLAAVRRSTEFRSSIIVGSLWVGMLGYPVFAVRRSVSDTKQWSWVPYGGLTLRNQGFGKSGDMIDRSDEG